MAYTKNLTAYSDVDAILRQALTSPEPLRLGFETEANAISWVHRANHYRKLYAQQHGDCPFYVFSLAREGNIVICKPRLAPVVLNPPEEPAEPIDMQRLNNLLDGVIFDE